MCGDGCLHTGGEEKGDSQLVIRQPNGTCVTVRPGPVNPQLPDDDAWRQGVEEPNPRDYQS